MEFLDEGARPSLAIATRPLGLPLVVLERVAVFVVVRERAEEVGHRDLILAGDDVWILIGVDHAPLDVAHGDPRPFHTRLAGANRLVPDDRGHTMKYDRYPFIPSGGSEGCVGLRQLACGDRMVVSVIARSTPAETYEYIIYIANSMPTISTRVPEDLEAELEAYLESERLDRSTAVRKLLSEGLEAWRTERALERFADGDVSLIKAAELAGLSVWEFADLVKDADDAWASSDHLEADLDEL